MSNKYLLLSAFIFLMACAENDATKKDEKELEGKLSTSLVDNPRTLNDNNPDALASLGRLSFEDTLHNFGILTEGEVVEYEFTFTNTGKRDIIINEAKASCGCTVADYPAHPFKPGQKDKIKVTFSSEGKPGMNERGVVVTTNGNPSVYTLTIQAQVNKK